MYRAPTLVLTAIAVVSIVSTSCAPDSAPDSEERAVEAAIDGAVYTTIEDARTPSVAIDSTSGAV